MRQADGNSLGKSGKPSLTMASGSPHFLCFSSNCTTVTYNISLTQNFPQKMWVMTRVVTVGYYRTPLRGGNNSNYRESKPDSLLQNQTMPIPAGTDLNRCQLGQVGDIVARHGQPVCRHEPSACGQTSCDDRQIYFACRLCHPACRQNRFVSRHSHFVWKQNHGVGRLQYAGGRQNQGVGRQNLLVARQVRAMDDE
jgi:hypothetical protein